MERLTKTQVTRLVARCKKAQNSFSAFGDMILVYELPNYCVEDLQLIQNRLPQPFKTLEETINNKAAKAV